MDDIKSIKGYPIKTERKDLCRESFKYVLKRVRKSAWSATVPLKIPKPPKPKMCFKLKCQYSSKSTRHLLTILRTSMLIYMGLMRGTKVTGDPVWVD